MSDLMISISGVRGIVNDTLTPETALFMASAFAQIIPAGPVVVGADGRTSGTLLKQACMAGLSASGRKVLDLGVATTPTMEMAVLHQKAAGAIIITASHNPAEWNGLKFLGPDGMFIRQDTLDDLISLWRDRTTAWQPWEGVTAAEVWSEASRVHIDAILNLDVIDVERCRSAEIPVVLDAVCASGAIIAPALLKELGCPTTEVNTDITGHFPRTPEPVPENIKPVGDTVRASGAALGMVLDPDGDRLALLDENGVPIGEEYTLALAVYAIRRKRPGGPIAVNASTSRMVDDVARMLGFEVIRTAVGEINVVQGMLNNEAELGGEGNGGVIYGPLHYGRDGMLGIALIIDLLAEEKYSLSELIDRIPRYAMYKTKFNVARPEIPAVLDKLRKSAAERGAEIDVVDGVKLVWSDRWVHARASNTEPVLRVIAEAPTQDAAEQLCAEVEALAT